MTSGIESAVESALARATALDADHNDGWETTAAVLAFEVKRLRRLWSCVSTDGPGDCHNHTPHDAPRGCVHHATWAPDRHDTTEGNDQ